MPTKQIQNLMFRVEYYIYHSDQIENQTDILHQG